jgi:hypothetical protein
VFARKTRSSLSSSLLHAWSDRWEKAPGIAGDAGVAASMITANARFANDGRP